MAGDPDDSDDLDSGTADTVSVGAGDARKRAPRAVRAGDKLGRYELLEEIGEGGMATVYRARDTELRRDVAVKVLFPHLARRGEIVRRFHREARAAAKLEHDNILRIYDVGGAGRDGAEDDPPYIVMELVRGTTLLGAVEQDGPMLAEIAACAGALLADALAVAHAAGIIHRDLKPANVLVAPGGRLLLADFGVARLEQEDASLVTKTGALLGTPAYMSPEQASGETATAQSDLYSLGASLYQLATGALPFAGSPAKVLAQIASGALVAPVRKRSAVGPDLSRAIEQLMATDASRRPASAKVVAAELRAIAAAGGLGDPVAECAAYFANPKGYVADRTPTIVATIVKHAKAAMAEAKLPRAMALADRASAIAPDDDSVKTLVDTVTAGGRSTRRKRAIAIGALGVAIAGGGVAGAWKLASSPSPGPTPSPPPTPLVDAAPPAADAALVLPERKYDAAEPDAAPPPLRPLLVDAPVRRTTKLVDAPPVADTAVVPPPIDAQVAPPADAPGSGAASSEAWIVVRNDVWCDILIDTVNHGRQRDKPLRVTPGHHVVKCSQMATGRGWTQEVDVAAGQTQTVSGQMQVMVEVHIDTSAPVQIGRMHYKPGAVIFLKADRYEVAIPGLKRFVDIRHTCSLKESPELDCY